MKLCDNNWDDCGGGHSIETFESKQKANGCLAISIVEQHYNGCQTATLTPDDCAALGMHLLMHAKKHGVDIEELFNPGCRRP